MRVGNEDKKKLIYAGIGGFCAIAALVHMYLSVFGGPSAPPPVQGPPVIVDATPTAGRAVGTVAPRAVASVPVAAAPAATGPGAKKVATANVQLDPTLHMEGMEATESLVYSGTGRNIFAPGPTPQELALAAIPKPVTGPRPAPAIAPTQVALGPPPKPPINLKFFGTATQDGKKRALLLAGDDVFLAAPGDIVQRRYRIVSIAANSITVEDMPNSNSQNLPLVAN
jgi:hypothetical protein